MDAECDGVRASICACMNADAKLSVRYADGQRKNEKDEECLNVLHGGSGGV
jgi:hypothetical protein